MAITKQDKESQKINIQRIIDCNNKLIKILERKRILYLKLLKQYKNKVISTEKEIELLEITEKVMLIEADIQSKQYYNNKFKGHATRIDKIKETK